MSDRIGVLFVCLGNICRSPLAEAVFRETVERSGLGSKFEIDSAGTSDYHIGDQPDPRTVRTAARRGVRVAHAARQMSASDLERFTYVLAMDASNLGRIEKIARATRGGAKVRLLRSFDKSAAARDDLEVPDPYYGGASGFDEVHDMVERACDGLLAHIRVEHALDA